MNTRHTFDEVNKSLLLVIRRKSDQRQGRQRGEKRRELNRLPTCPTPPFLVTGPALSERPPGLLHGGHARGPRRVPAGRDPWQVTKDHTYRGGRAVVCA
eukprot:1178830-Prorocentrum_minimum.AAC.4